MSLGIGIITVTFFLVTTKKKMSKIRQRCVIEIIVISQKINDNNLSVVILPKEYYLDSGKQRKKDRHF